MRLELVPRGVGKIEVQAVNLYHEIKVGEKVEHGSPGQKRRAPGNSTISGS